MSLPDTDGREATQDGPHAARAGSLVADLRRAARVAPELSRGLWITALLAVIGTGGHLLVPLTVQRLVDRALAEADVAAIDDVLLLGAVAVVLAIIAGFASWRAMFRLVRAAAAGLAQLRVAAFRQIHRLSVVEVDGDRRGALVSRVTSDVEAITQFVEWGGVGMLVGGAQVGLVLVVMVTLNPVLAALVVVAAVAYAALIAVFQRVLARAHDGVRVRAADSLTAMGEVVAGLPVVRAYGAEARSRERVDEALEAQFQAEFRVGVLGAALFSSAEVFAAAVIAGVVSVGVIVGAGGTISAGTLVAFLFLVNLFIEPVQLLVEILDQAQSAGAGVRRILGVLDMADAIVEPADPVALPAGPLTLGLHGVGYAYPGGPPVLHDLDVTVEVGERIAVVGRTGSGKSTFVRLAVRLVDPTSGSVTLSGVPLTSVASDELRQRVAYVPQDGFLFDTTVARNVAYGVPGCTDEMVREAFAQLDLLDWLDGLSDGLATEVGERGRRLSAGEQQLVALARAWIVHPDLLVLDEATSAVDAALEVRLRRAIERMTAGRTSVTVAHRLSTAEAADRVLVFSDGRIVESGPHRELVAADGVYAALHRDWEAGTGDIGA
jgi:ATP-binding cassette, subfamily B, bacterial